MENDCIFCKIINGQIPADIVYQDDKILAFSDINPIAPVHILIIPKQHIKNVEQIDEKNADLIGYIFEKAGEIAKSKNLCDGYRVVVNTGKDAGQSVFHVHFHLIGGRQLAWPAG